MRTVYLLASYLLMPLLLLHLALSGFRNPAFLKRWRERFAYYHQGVPPDGIVIHAVSVGEVNAAAPLIRALLVQYPGLPITVTSFTPTGSERVRELFAEKVFHSYSPLDLPGAAKRFITHTQPRLLVVMETEIWPNLYFAAANANIPIMIANARISGKSFPRYRRLRGLTRAALAQVTCIGAQSEADARRFKDIGAEPERIKLTGNLKFDVSLPPELLEQGQVLRRAWGDDRPVFLAGSTHEGDETPVLTAFLGILESLPGALLVWVPRHPERFQRVAQLATNAGLTLQLKSEAETLSPETQCLVVDSMGELQLFYAACDVAFVGGSLDRIGGHNVLEAAALSIPVLVGPHTFNFADITRRLIDCGGAECVRNAAELQHAATRLLSNAPLRQQMGAAGLALLKSGQGAVAQSMQIISHLLGPVDGPGSDQFNN